MQPDDDDEVARIYPDDIRDEDLQYYSQAQLKYQRQRQYLQQHGWVQADPNYAIFTKDGVTLGMEDGWWVRARDGRTRWFENLTEALLWLSAGDTAHIRAVEPRQDRMN